MRKSQVNRCCGISGEGLGAAEQRLLHGSERGCHGAMVSWLFFFFFLQVAQPKTHKSENKNELVARIKAVRRRAACMAAEPTAARAPRPFPEGENQNGAQFLFINLQSFPFHPPFCPPKIQHANFVSSLLIYPEISPSVESKAFFPLVNCCCSL